MNYLSHYYCEYPADDPNYILGVILPDLAHSREKLHFRLLPDGRFSSERVDVRTIHQGVARHFEVDYIFHNSDFFHEQTSFLKELLFIADLTALPRRVFVFAHILLEIVMDRMLLKDDSNICESFYSLLEQADPDSLLEYIKSRTNNTEPRKLTEYLDKFLTHRFLFYYSNNEKLLYALNRMNQKIGNQFFSSQDEHKLIDVVERLEEQLHDEKMSIFKLLR